MLPSSLGTESLLLALHSDSSSVFTILNLGQIPLPGLLARNRQQQSVATTEEGTGCGNSVQGTPAPFCHPEPSPLPGPPSGAMSDCTSPLNPTVCLPTQELPVSFCSPLIIVQSCPPFLNWLCHFWELRGPLMGCTSHVPSSPSPSTSLAS